jgi:hypothetical protein
MIKIDDYNLKINKYESDIQLSYYFVKSISGNYIAIDRTEDEDQYKTTIKTGGEFSQVKEAYEKIKEFETTGAIDLTFINDDESTPYIGNEYIFGLDIDYTETISCVLSNVSKFQQKERNTYSFSFDLIAESPSFLGSATMPNLLYLDYGFSGDKEFDNIVNSTYENQLNYYNRETKYPIFEGIFNFTFLEARNFSRFIADNRGANFNITNIGGIDYPFGVEIAIPTAGYTVKILDWKIKEMAGIGRYKTYLKLQYVSSY